jgi:effector-binding domain-containing protein
MSVFKVVLLGIVGLCVVLCGVAYLLPQQCHVERSTMIAAPPATVFTLVNGYKRFNEWSPWAEMDPNAAYTYSGPATGVGAKLAWKGNPKTVGEGSQTITASKPYTSVSVDLDFGPQGIAKAAYSLTPTTIGTRVTWGLDTDLGMNPVSRWFGLMMDGMLGKDFEKGLANLKTLAESLPKHDFAGLDVEMIDAAPVRIAYVSSSAPKDEAAIGQAMGAAYGKIGAAMRQWKVQQAGAPISINKSWGDAGLEFDAAIPISAAPEPAPAPDSPVQVKETYAGKALKVVHKGAYSGMEATYDKLFAYAEASGLEQNGPPWDQYVTDPGSTPEPELLTYIYLPVK